MQDFWKDPENIFAANSKEETKLTPDHQEPKIPPRKFNMGNDKDRYEYFQLLKLKALVDNPDAVAKPIKVKEKESNIIKDEQGNYSGLKHSVINGIHATVKNQADLLKALRADTYKRHGIKE
ncbi:MAG TPA: hypothetical protein VIM98_01315 [Dyella sp.]|uniref:hypothetical protein n=1 Tax=Dyella sp. TaxID=1869338 RepID=UPI002F93F54F